MTEQESFHHPPLDPTYARTRIYLIAGIPKVFGGSTATRCLHTGSGVRLRPGYRL